MKAPGQPFNTANLIQASISYTSFNFILKIGIEDDPLSSVSIYTKVVVKIEQLSELTHFILMKVALGVIVVPPIIVSYSKYYILGLGDASFQDFTTM